MFIKKEEKQQIIDQIANLEELNNKQSETISELKNQNSILMDNQDKQKTAFNDQISQLVKINASQAETIDELKKQNTILLDKQEKQGIAFDSQLAVLEEAKIQQSGMLKILSEQNAELQRTNMSMIEQRDKSEAVLVEAVGKIADVKEYRTTVYTPEQKEKAAYALNLCMVSISQIVDYNDLYILDQEYDMVLNNLNLENMPKDEALLKILKQTLDTITYFKIQEGDKKFIEIEYQHNIKNAIWRAVPRNLNILTCGAAPWTMAVSAGLSIACQVGTGFMNYRRNKADYNINRDKQLWQLQRSAMEQFNGLRRDLFDTAWRLADEYKFADELRLTEKQIELYDEILDDSDDMRRFERLDIIKGAFEAYPPFWYFIGDTAAKIASNDTNSIDIRSKFKALAITYFEKFIEKSKLNLLREDTLLATCALEYMELLDINNDRDKIYELLEVANKNAGNENDIIELIGVAYMKMDDYIHSSQAFRRLINEGYNIGINSQLLSSLYVQEYLNDKSDEKHKKEVEELYSLLLSRTKGHNIFRLPKDSGDDWNKINTEFLSIQQFRIIEQFNNMIEQLEIKYNIEYNKLLPLDLMRNRVFPDNWYKDDDEVMFNKRIYELTRIAKRADLFVSYSNYYNEENYSNAVLALFSKMISCVNNHLQSIISLDEASEYAVVAKDSDINIDISDYLFNSLRFYSGAIRGIDNAFENNEADSSFIENVKNARYSNLTNSYFTELSKRGEDNIKKITNMSDLFDIESKIRALCVDQGIRIMSQSKVDSDQEVKDNIIPLEVIYGESAQVKKDNQYTMLSKKREIINQLKDNEKDIVLDPSETVILTDKDSIRLYANRSKLAYDLLKKNILAIINDLGKKNKDLIFTMDGIYIIENDRYLSSGEVFKYLDTKYFKTNTITFERKRTVAHRVTYTNPAINMDKFNSVIMDIGKMLKSV